MDASVCKICGVKHWGTEHIWPKEKGGQVEKGTPGVASDSHAEKAEQQKPKSGQVGHGLVEGMPFVSVSRPCDESAVSASFDRKTYQREYMRAYRRWKKK